MRLTRLAALLASSVVPLCVLGACGAASSPDAVSAVEASVDPDVDPFARAMRRASARYRQEVELAVSRTYRTRDEADAVLLGLSRAHFEDLVSAELDRGDVTRGALRRHVLEHDECAAQHETVQMEAAGVQMMAERVREQVVSRPSTFAFDRQLDDPYHRPSDAEASDAHSIAQR